MDLIQLYEENKDFKEYVDRYSNHHNEGRSIPVAEALQHEVVRCYAEFILSK